ncbi:MAG TPA: adenylate/guanylate cyclase domain-containing protein [Kofleriaceae bacterium]|nr:adenylate/guanylate cyclase domain-containing protein [Kofleriaceae bacterium]
MRRQLSSPRARKLINAALVGAVVGVVTAVLAYTRPLVLERGEFWTYDQRVRAAAKPADASKDIVLIDISEQSIEDVENNLDLTWPWPRALYGYITQYCQRAGAKVLVYDWLFQDRGYSVTDAEEFAAAMREAGNVVIGLAFTRQELVQRPSTGLWAAELPSTFADRAEALKIGTQLLAWNTRVFIVGDKPARVLYGAKSKPEDVVAAWRRMSSAEEIAAAFATEGEEPASEPGPPVEPAPFQLTEDHLAHELTAATMIRDRDGITGGNGDVAIETRTALDPPLAVIAAAPRRGGNVYQDGEADGIFRRHTPLIRHGDRMYPSLALAAYLVGHPDSTAKIEGRELVLGSRRLELDAEGKIGIRYHGRGTYQHIPAYDILQSLALLDENKPPVIPFEQLKDKYVIVSATGQSLRDVRNTPVHRTMLGAEIQATMLDNLLTGHSVRRTRPITDAVVSFFLCVAVAIGVVAMWMAIRRAGFALLTTSAVAAVALFGYWLIASYVYGRSGLWIAVATPGLGVVGSTFAVLLVTSASERRQRRFVQGALGMYTSPALVKELIENPQHLTLEWGQKREMTVYFSDIAGFTTISEGLTPEKLVALLNDYLTNMTDLVLEHGGVVDKYIGDAVMAFWGAPIPNEAHAVSGIKCAIAMRKRCEEMRPKWKEEYGVDVTARAGLSSGHVVVGNMGSKHKLNYTVMGDMVNLASRLEGANKAYGTYLMISETCHAQVKDLVVARELDYLAVKGKERPVTVYEVIGLDGDVEASWTGRIEAFHAALVRYRARDFAGALAAFESILRGAPDDGPSKAYVERCTYFLEEPPGEDWDGVWHMKEK